MKQILFLVTLFFSLIVCSQEKQSNTIIKKFLIKNDSLKIDSLSISPFDFKILDKKNKIINSKRYKIDFSKATLILKDTLLKNQNITVKYKKLPRFLTKTYSFLNDDLIVDKTSNLSKLHQFRIKEKNNFKELFGNLNTNGSIARGITVGNNQDGVLNANFNLQIAGNLSSKVKIRANITDSNVPIQNNGYTQRLNEFDKIFIELYSKKWHINAGDIDFKNTNSHYLNFNKKVAGLSLNFNLNHKNSTTKIFNSAALVKGKFTQVDLTAQESNQGPYKLTTVNNSFLLIISNSETVYINGLPLKRGENNDYTINYNTAEITFNTTLPINANMRIHVEFQASDQNYNRFISFNSAQYNTKKTSIKLGLYNEIDAKNSTLQQDLNNNQIEILNNAGDDFEQMIVPSAIQEAYIENKIQYKKETLNGIEIFIFSNDENDDLYGVKFTYAGQNLGDYKIANTVATGRVYQYIAPLNGIKQGDYNPVFQIIAPTKLQIAQLEANFNPTKKINIKTEFAYSINDKNLFSSINDNDNNGLAGNLNYKHTLIDKKWKLNSLLSFETIRANFKTVERIQKVEFNRKWNITNPLGNQNNLTAGLQYKNDSIGYFEYQFNKLDFNTNFNGKKHRFIASISKNNYVLNSETNSLESTSLTEKTTYNQTVNNFKYKLKKMWLGGLFNLETNKRKDNQTQQLNNLSHKNITLGSFIGVGDSTKIFTEIGYQFNKNDSISNTQLTKFNHANTLYLNSKLINTKKANLNIYINYRTVNNVFLTNNKSINSRVNYNQKLFNDLINLNTNFETSNGRLPQQDYNYIEVEPGQGFYKWNDYNNNGIQELEEFEIAQFLDQAIYLRVLLPSTNFIKTNNSKFSQSLNINFSKWNTKTKFGKIRSHFTNQTTLLIDKKQNQNNNLITINPFKTNGNDILGLNYNLKNSLFFNRGKQKYSTTYAFYKTKNKTVFVTGNQENKTEFHNLQFQHKLFTNWLLELNGIYKNNSSFFETFIARNFDINSNKFESKLAYLPNNNTKLEAFFNTNNQLNTIGNLETLNAKSMGLNFQYSKSQTLSINTLFSFINNDFVGNQNSAIAFQMLEGLQNGQNFIWNILLQKKINSYLNLNFNYNGRKSDLSKTIHVGSVQLKANF